MQVYLETLLKDMARGSRYMNIWKSLILVISERPPLRVRFALTYYHLLKTRMTTNGHKFENASVGMQPLSQSLIST